MTKENRPGLLDTITDVFEKVDKYVGIVSAIIAALTFAAGNRIVSYAFVIFGYILLASFLWRVVTQTSPVKRMIATVRPLAEEQRYDYPKHWRWTAAIALILLTLFSFGWVGVNVWQDRQAREGLLFPKARSGELLVIIAQFDNRSTKGIDPTQRIYDGLDKELNEAGIAARLEKVAEIANSDEARELGKQYGAPFVIWGWFDDIGFTPNFTIAFLPEGLELEEVPVEPPRDFSLYIREGLPAQMAFFSTFTVGQIYYWDESYEEALRAFDRAVENAQEGGASENLAGVYFFRGQIYLVPLLDDSQQAIANYEQAIACEPDFAEAYNSLGIAYAKQGKLDEALVQFSEAINRPLIDESMEREKRAVMHFNLARTYDAQEELEKAAEEYTKSIELAPHLAEAYQNLGLAYVNLGRPDEAIRTWKDCVATNPDYAEPYFCLGYAYEVKKEEEKAKSYYQRFLELSSDEDRCAEAKERLEKLDP